MLRQCFTIALAWMMMASLGFAAEGGWVKLVNKDKGMVLAIEFDSGDAGAKLCVAKDDNTIGQQWKLEKSGDQLKLVNRKSGMVMDVEGESHDEGANIVQWDDKSEGNDNQRWSWQGEGKERRIKSKHSGHVLDIGDENMIVQKAVIESSKSQLWEVVDIKD
jgi:hypothetical protein